MEMKRVKIGAHEIAYQRLGKGIPLVLLHGYPLDSTIWLGTARILQDDCDVIMPDLRGFGESTLSVGEYSMIDLAADLAGILDAAGIESAFVAGHSMGGYVALAFAEKYPARVRGLALVASQALPDTEERKTGRYQSVRDIEERGVEPVAAAMSLKLTPNQITQRELHLLIGRQQPGALVHALRAMAGRQDMSGLLAGFLKPLVLIHDEFDELIPFARAVEIKAINPNARLVALNGSGHVPMLELPGETAAGLRSLF